MHEYIDDVKKRYELWWQGQNEGPLLYMIFPREGHVYPGDAVRPWMTPAKVAGWTAWQHEFLVGQAVALATKTSDLRYVHEAATVLERYADATEQAAEGYHFLFLNLGASMMSAYLTGVTRYDGDTIWLERTEPLALDEILQMNAQTGSAYANTALAALEIITQRLEGRFIFGTPELGGILDVLSAMRTGMNLLMDTADEPEKLDACVALFRRLYWQWQQKMEAIILPRNQGCCAQAMRMLSASPSDIGTCDFSSMISPEAFARWVLPHLRDQGTRYNGRLYFHLDGVPASASAAPAGIAVVTRDPMGLRRRQTAQPRPLLGRSLHPNSRCRKKHHDLQCAGRCSRAQGVFQSFSGQALLCALLRQEPAGGRPSVAGVKSHLT